MTDHGMNKQFEEQLQQSHRMTFSGFIWCHSGFDLSRIAILCFNQGDCLCLRHSCCIDSKIEQRGCGMVTKKEHGEICKIGCYCCDYGLVSPQVLCAQSHQILCCYSVQQCPFGNEHQSGPVCAYLCLQCLPDVGCCASPGECRALNHIHKNRNLEIYPGMPEEEEMERE